MTLYALTGSHRSGKSSLATAVAKQLSIDYVPIKTSAVAKAAGYDPMSNMSLVERLDLQCFLFEDMTKTVAAIKGPAILDRSPIDHIAYLLGEMSMRSFEWMTPKYQEIAQRFIDKALDFTARNFDYIYYLQPLPVYEVADDKPAPDRIYQMQNGMLCLGLLAQNSHLINWGNVPPMPLQQRTSALAGIISRRLAELSAMRNSTTSVH